MKELVVTKAAITSYLQFLKIQEKARELWKSIKENCWI